MSGLHEIREIVFPQRRYDELLGHALRKLRGEYLPDEEAAPKAYGLLGGRQQGSSLTVTHVLPLRRNLRSEPRYKRSSTG